MYVSRKVLSVNNMQQIVSTLRKQKIDLQQEFGEASNIAILWLPLETQAIEGQIAQLEQKISLLSDEKSAFQKLSLDIEQAIDSYEKNCPKHAEQRTGSIFRVREWLELLRSSNKSAAKKRLDLGRCIVRELNAVENDHNKSSFSRLFTESRLARAYIEVLRDNSIDPTSEQYLYIGPKTVTRDNDSMDSISNSLH
ncbi:MAG: hypothetical protein M1561_01640 [Gammaproteobacteria bacterium]|nr:hypothetical protein [Gammaproteobacteria bacterium]